MRIATITSVRRLALGYVVFAVAVLQVQAQEIKVKVRIIRAEHLQRDILDEETAQEGRQPKINFASGTRLHHKSMMLSYDPRLLDLSDQLKQFQFQKYKLISEQEASVPLKKKQTIVLPYGQILSIRPIHFENGAASLWLNWKDPTGEDILDTRVHLGSADENNRESGAKQTILAGAESMENSAMILAISLAKE